MTEQEMQHLSTQIHLELHKAEADDCILDELVYDTAESIGSDAANQGPEDEAESVIDDYAAAAGNVNNTGWAGQVLWLLRNGVSEKEIRDTIKGTKG